MQFFTDNANWIALAASIIGIIFAAYISRWILAQDGGNEKMTKIANAIQRGAQAFLSREYRYVGMVVVGVVIVLLLLSAVSNLSPWTAVAFVSGAAASALAGYIGMSIAVRANVRTTAAASKSLNQGLRVAFASGTVMGMTVVSLALLGISILFFVMNSMIPDKAAAANALAGFGFGGTCIAIFARVGGGIFTKAADVGADLVGKTEAGIPEDDPRNPAVIADNVGDNVGDVAGMGSDLFESYAGSIVAAIALAALSEQIPVTTGEAYPLLVAASGLLISMGCTFLVRTEEQATQESLLGSLRRGVYSSSLLVAVAIIFWGLLLGLGWGSVIATLIGLVAGVAIGYITEYYTSDTYRPTQQLSESSAGGPAIVIIQGLSIGMVSTMGPVLVVIAATLVAFAAAGFYGVAMAAVGMLSTLGITLATDAYGPVADNAGGIAEMAGLEGVVRERTDALDSLGNTTAATGKGFAIGSAAMTALALVSAFVAAVDPNTINSTSGSEYLSLSILDPRLLTGLMLGAALPYLFSAQTMLAVSKAAQQIVIEVRRQFKEIPGLMEGTADPDYERCVAISTDSAIREMILPGAIAVVIPVGIALIAAFGNSNPNLGIQNFVSAETLVGIQIGSLISAFMLAVMMANAGGAWDNAKKYIERGNLGGKRSDAHKAAVVGDTVGDPFKDTSGPSLNILLKLLAIVSLVIAPLLAKVG
jgi:K(+)-stimulated pyrophosphate-energized sodium pump